MQETKPNKPNPTFDVTDGLQNSVSNPHRNDRSELNASELDALIDSMRLEPVMIRRMEHSKADPATEFGISLDPALMDLMVRDSKVPRNRLCDTLRRTVYPRFLIKPNEAYRKDMVDSGLIYSLQAPLENHYYLQIGANGDAQIRYQSIIGGRKMVSFTPPQIARIVALGAKMLIERDREYAPIFLVESAKTARTIADKNVGSDIQSQLKLLYIGTDPKHVRMPEIQLSHYTSIKGIMLNAGAAYKADKEGSYFLFPKDIDAEKALLGIQAGERPNIQQETQFFGTPKPVAEKAVATFDGGVSGKRFLEPSAGDGALAKELRTRYAQVTCIENWKANVEALKKAGFSPIENDFLKVSPSDLGAFDGVLMNPPFTKGADMAHVRHALGFLTPEGELVAIMSPAFKTNSTKGPKQFKELMELAEAHVVPIEKNAFKESGTGVATVQIHVRMEQLLNALDSRNETGEEYGLNLFSVLKQRQENSVSSSESKASSKVATFACN